MQRKKASEEGRKQVCQFRMSIGIPVAGSTNHFSLCHFAFSRVSILGSTSLVVNRRRGAEGARSPGVAAIR